MIDSRKPRIPGSYWRQTSDIEGVFEFRDPEPNPVDFKIVEDWTEEFSDEPLINLKEVLWVCPLAEPDPKHPGVAWWEDPDDWEVHTPGLTPVAPKALPYLEEVNWKSCVRVRWLKMTAHDGDWARRNGILNLQFIADTHRATNMTGEGAFYKGVPRGFKGAIQENMRFLKVLHGGNGKLRRKVKMNLVNKEL